MKELMKKCLAVALAVMMLPFLPMIGETALAVEILEPTAVTPYGKYAEPVKITIGSITTVSAGDTGDTATDNAFLDYLKDAMNIELEWEIESASGDDYKTALNLAIAAEALPDAFIVTDYGVLCELVEADLLMDIGEVIDAHLSDWYKNEFASLSYDAFKKVTFDGKVMALPQCSADSGAFVYIRQDWLDKLGIKVDEDGDRLITREELEMVAAEFVKNDPGNSGNPIGFALEDTATAGYDYSSNLVNGSFGARVGWWYKGENGSYVNGAATPEMKDALAWWADMFQKGLLDPQYGITKTADIKEMLANNRLGIEFGGWQKATSQYKDVYPLDPEADFVLYGLDNGTGKETFVYPDAPNRYLVISKECEHPEVPIKILNLYQDISGGRMDKPEVQEAYPEFYEGYASVNRTGVITMVDPLNLGNGFVNKRKTRYDEFNAYAEGKSTLDDFTDAVARNAAIGYDGMKDGTADPKGRMYVDHVEGLDMWFWFSAAENIERVTMPAKLSTDATGMYQADLDTLVLEMMIKIITGEETIEYFDSFVEEFYSRGGDEIAADYQALYQ